MSSEGYIYTGVIREDLSTCPSGSRAGGMTDILNTDEQRPVLRPKSATPTSQNNSAVQRIGAGKRDPHVMGMSDGVSCDGRVREELG